MATEDKRVSFETTLKNAKQLRNWILEAAKIWNKGKYKEDELFRSQELILKADVVALQTQLQQILEEFGPLGEYDNDDVIALHKSLMKLLGCVEAKL